MKLRKFLWSIYKPIAETVASSPLNSLVLIAPMLKKLNSYCQRLLTPTIEIINGHRVELGPNPTPWRAYDYLKSYDASPYFMLQKVLKPGMNVVDIGAHIGLLTLQAARLVGPNGKVYAFEPHPENFAVLLRNIKMNGYRNVVALNKAVTNQNGVVKLFTHPLDSVQHSIFRRTSLTGQVVVECVRLDDFLEEQAWPQIDLVKIDVEGAEPLVIEGMEKLILRGRLRLIVELSPPCLKAGGFSPSAFLDQLCKLGFAISVIRFPSELEPLPDDPSLLLEELELGKTGYKYCDLFCEKL